MPDLNSTLAAALTARYQKLSTALHDQAAPLTEDEFWTKPSPSATASDTSSSI